jgi:hypothetical protein
MQESSEFSGIVLIEDDNNQTTHGGGSLEPAVGFSMLEPMVHGMDESAAFGLPEAYDQMPLATSIQYGGGLQETVCGRDGRVYVGQNGAQPWGMICQLIIRWPMARAAAAPAV